MKKKWEFKYDEEIFDTLGSNFVGVITDGDHFLFFHALPEPGLDNEICHIFSSMSDLFNHDNQELSYPWTKENDDLLLEALNSLEEGSDRYCGENSIFHEFFAAGDLGNPQVDKMMQHHLGFTHLYPQMQIPLPDTFKNCIQLIRQNLHARCGSILADFLVCCPHRPCGCFTNEVEPDKGY